MMCNFIGNERWVEQLDTKFYHEFAAAQSIPWITLESGVLAGTVRSAGRGGFGAGNVTFVTVHEAGCVSQLFCVLHTSEVFFSHMVPYDQPEAALVSATFGSSLHIE